MPKFYVQCGPIEVVLTADSHEHAALSALDRHLQNHVWIYDDPGLTERDRHDHLMLEALMYLEPSISISEKGFGSNEAESVGTPDTIEHWHKLMVGMQRLFVAAGLETRTMSDVAGGSDPASHSIANRCPR